MEAVRGEILYYMSVFYTEKCNSLENNTQRVLYKKNHRAGIYVDTEDDSFEIFSKNGQIYKKKHLEES